MERETAEPAVEELPGPKASEWVDFHRGSAATSTYVYEFVWDITKDYRCWRPPKYPRGVPQDW